MTEGERLALATELLRQHEARYGKLARSLPNPMFPGLAELLDKTETFLDEEFAEMGVPDRQKIYGRSTA